MSILQRATEQVLCLRTGEGPLIVFPATAASEMQKWSYNRIAALNATEPEIPLSSGDYCTSRDTQN